MAPARRRKEHPNVTVAKELWSAAAEGDAEGVLRLLDPEVVWTSTGRNPLSGVWRGPGGVLEFLARIGDAAGELLSTLESVFVNDEGAVITYHTQARRGAKMLEMDYLLLLRMRDGRVYSGLMVAADQHVNDEFWA